MNSATKSQHEGFRAIGILCLSFTNEHCSATRSLADLGDFPRLSISPVQCGGTCSDALFDLEVFFVALSEKSWMRQECFPVESSIVSVRSAEVGSVIPGACVTVIVNMAITAKPGIGGEQQEIADCLVFNADFLAAVLCGCFSSNVKLFKLSSNLSRLSMCSKTLWNWLGRMTVFRSPKIVVSDLFSCSIFAPSRCQSLG
jgi:hypothetical protein